MLAQAKAGVCAIVNNFVPPGSVVSADTTGTNGPANSDLTLSVIRPTTYLGRGTAAGWSDGKNSEGGAAFNCSSCTCTLAQALGSRFVA
jgi:hypothetical protein